jgi:acyl-[acyl-carrier-protein]-phospholipid O-acyltransferase/long-chain-fatty-acid--[acyl-carrier-protein] ligase
MDGMVMIEDLMAGVTTGDKLKAILKSLLPVSILLSLLHSGNENDTAAMLFTSGSEKDPKAVPLSHKNVISNIEGFSDYLGVSSEDKLISNLVFFHVFGLTVNLWVPFYHGMTNVTYANPLDFQTVSRIAREEKPTIMVGTPSFFWGYLQKSDPGDFKSLRFMITGADKCPDALREGFRNKHGVVLLEGYGTTETSPVISVNSLEFNRPGSTGKVLPNIQVRIENFETGQDCSVGEIGKILVKGPSVMKGYYDDSEQTAEVLKDGWYNTGDMGYLDKDGYLWHAGRFKRFTKVGGEMVSLVKVENTLEKYLPPEVLCCVVEIMDEKKGSLIIAAVSAEINKTEILRKMMTELPVIALPRQFLTINELPVMGTGKVDFRTVTRMVQEIMNKPGA